MIGCKSTLGVAVLVLALVSGCGGNREWEIVVENQCPTPCSVVVETSYNQAGGKGTSDASIQNVAKDKRLILLTGTLQTAITSVKVTQKKEEQKLEPKVEIVPGKRLLILVEPDGKVKTTLMDK